MEADTDTDTDADTDADTDTDTDTDTDADTDTDTGTPTNFGLPVATQPCLWAHGIHSASTTADFRWLNPQRLGSRTVDVFEYDATLHTATLRTQENWTQTTGGVSHTGTTYEYVVCNDDGLYLLQRIVDATTTYTVGGTTTDTTDTDTTYSTPALLRPNSIALNDSWTTTYTGTVVSPGVPDQRIDNSGTTTAVEVDVFLANTSDNNYNAIRFDDGRYWQMGFGIVRSGSLYQLDGFTP